ncbi:MAG: hypothetical protein FD188_205 [Ignavibacteria bacterium]|nr:MAG: hypothetical protein FD188_205 [Ignavibacteria bacterium]
MNVKIGSGNIKGLQQSILELQKLKNAEFKKELLEQKKDLKEISKDSLNLKNLDAENSNITYTQQLIDFNLVFNFFTTVQVFADGKIEREEQSLEVIFKYSFQREVEEDGKSVVKDFLFELKMKAGFEETVSEEKKFEKEDILNFIQRVVNEIFDTFNDNFKTLRTVIIDKDDFEKIAKTGKGELARLLQSLLGAVFSFIKYKEMNNKSLPGVSFVLHPQREEHEAKEYSVSRIESFTVEIKQLEDKQESKATSPKEIQL